MQLLFQSVFQWFPDSLGSPTELPPGSVPRHFRWWTLTKTADYAKLNCKHSERKGQNLNLSWQTGDSSISTKWKDKCKILQWGWEIYNQMHRYNMGNNQLGSSSAGKDLKSSLEQQTE